MKTVPIWVWFPLMGIFLITLICVLTRVLVLIRDGNEKLCCGVSGAEFAIKGIGFTRSGPQVRTDPILAHAAIKINQIH